MGLYGNAEDEEGSGMRKDGRLEGGKQWPVVSA